MWLPLVPTPLGTWPTTQACALTGNRTSEPLVRRPALSPLSHTSQGLTLLFKVSSDNHFALIPLIISWFLNWLLSLALMKGGAYRLLS